MSQSTVKWWQWLLAGAVFGAVAVVTGPLADRHGYATSVGFAFSLLALMICIVCWIVGGIRLVKWAWSLRRSA